MRLSAPITLSIVMQLKLNILSCVFNYFGQRTTLVEKYPAAISSSFITVFKTNFPYIYLIRLKFFVQ